MGNLDLYEKVRKVPQEAQKIIEAGRLKGKTDINPMWRIKKLTEEFGPCGFGWYAPITERWIEDGANGERTANIRINLFVKLNGEWSEPIEGIGGSVLIAKEKAGFYTDDDCFKKAYTDAISVACKALGFGGDIYWQKDPSKYDKNKNDGGRVETNTENEPKKAPKSNDNKKSFLPISRTEMLTEYGVKNVEEMVCWLEKQFQKKMKDWDKQDCDEIRAFLGAQKEKREREAKKLKEGLLSADGELPFEND